VFTMSQRIGIRDTIPSKKGMVWKRGNSTCVRQECLIELPADHRAGGGGGLQSSYACVISIIKTFDIS
jgi:hypothetical protein